MDKIKILGIDYSIGYRSERTPASADLYDCKIFIDTRSNAPDHQKSVLIHEIVEVLNYRLEWGLEHSKISQLEAGIYSALKDNPDLISFLTKEEVDE